MRIAIFIVYILHVIHNFYLAQSFCKIIHFNEHFARVVILAKQRRSRGLVIKLSAPSQVGMTRLELGMTRLELATSRPPDVCATNCATSRSLRFVGAKVRLYIQISKFKIKKNLFACVFLSFLLIFSLYSLISYLYFVTLCAKLLILTQ